MAEDLHESRARRSSRRPQHARQRGSGRGRRGRHLQHREAPNASRKAWGIALVTTTFILGAAGTSLAFTSATVADPRSAHALAMTSQAAAADGATCPLSGLPAPGGHVPRRPALAIKVDNYPSARPQSGLDQADIVFEEPVEGGITRLVAVFQCQQADLVGPIRSAREVDAQILDELSKPIFVHVGGIAPVLSIIAAADDYDEDVPAIGSVVQNVPGRYPPYDTYISTSAGWELEPSDTTPPSPIFRYSQRPPKGSQVSSINIPYSGTNDVTWTWDSASGRWLLSYSGDAATDADGSPIAVPNVVVQMVNVTYGPWAENSLGALEVESQLTGSGSLMVFRDGREVTGTWQRSSLDSPTNLVAADGSTISLQPGETWVEIVPTSIPVNTTRSTSSTDVSP